MTNMDDIFARRAHGPDHEAPAEGRVVTRIKTRNPVPCVYMVEAVGADLIKIGTVRDANNLQRRLQNIQAGCPYDLRIVYVFFDRGRLDESRLHKRFDAFRFRSEWFKCEGDVKEFADAAKRGTSNIEDRANALFER